MKLYLFIASIFWVQVSSGQEISKTATPKIWSLQDCIAYALANNISVKDAALSTQIAEVNLYKSQSAKLPNVFGSASQVLSNGNAIDPITSEFTSEQIHSSNVGISSSVTLFQGKQINKQIEQNQLLLEQNSLVEEAEKNSITLNLLETYLQALYSKESITIAKNNFLAAEKEVQRAKARYEAEAIALSDYTEAQSQAASQKYSVISAQNTYRQTLITLKQLLELPPGEEIELQPLKESGNIALPSLSTSDVYFNAITFLPEIQASQMSISAYEKELEIAKGGYYPSLVLTGSLGSGYTSINQLSFSDQFHDNFNQRLALSLSIPIFNRNQTKSEVQAATINIQKARIQKQYAEKEVYQKIETAYQNALAAQEQLQAAQAAQEAAQQSYLLAQKKYELGGLSTTDLVISQNTYSNAQQNYLQAKYLGILYYQLLRYYQGKDIQLQ